MYDLALVTAVEEETGMDQYKVFKDYMVAARAAGQGADEGSRASTSSVDTKSMVPFETGRPQQR